MDEPTHDWITAIKARKLSGAVCTLLDAAEPLGPLAAQLLYVLQPVSGLFGWRDAIQQIAGALEEPGGIEAIRQRLQDDDPTV